MINTLKMLDQRSNAFTNHQEEFLNEVREHAAWWVGLGKKIKLQRLGCEAHKRFIACAINRWPEESELSIASADYRRDRTSTEALPDYANLSKQSSILTTLKDFSPSLLNPNNVVNAYERFLSNEKISRADFEPIYYPYREKHPGELLLADCFSAFYVDQAMCRGLPVSPDFSCEFSDKIMEISEGIVIRASPSEVREVMGYEAQRNEKLP